MGYSIYLGCERLQEFEMVVFHGVFLYLLPGVVFHSYVVPGGVTHVCSDPNTIRWTSEYCFVLILRMCLAYLLVLNEISLPGIILLRLYLLTVFRSSLLAVIGKILLCQQYSGRVSHVLLVLEVRCFV